MSGRVFPASIRSITGRPTQRITLDVPADYLFTAGQYLYVQHPDGTEIPLSIASAPHQLPLLELHYRSTPGAAEAQAMDDLLTGQRLQISTARGDVRLADQQTNQLFIAGGTGVAQAFSCLQHRHQYSWATPTTLLWCVDSEADVYLLDQLQKMQRTEVVVKIDAQRSDSNAGLLWLRENAARFAAAAVIISGSPAFVYAVTDELTGAGFSPSQLQADVYAYAPRS